MPILYHDYLMEYLHACQPLHRKHGQGLQNVTDWLTKGSNSTNQNCWMLTTSHHTRTGGRILSNNTPLPLFLLILNCTFIIMMLHNLYHTEYIDHCIRISSTIRILPDMRVPIFVGRGRLPDNVLQWALSRTGGTLIQAFAGYHTKVVLLSQCSFVT